MRLTINFARKSQIKPMNTEKKYISIEYIFVEIIQKLH